LIFSLHIKIQKGLYVMKTYLIDNRGKF